MLAKRLLRLLTLLAVLLSPAALLGEHAAMAMPAAPMAAEAGHHAGAAAPAHCPDSAPAPERQSRPDIDCMMACSAIAAPAVELADHEAIVGLDPPAPLSAGLSGRQPESDPPPPRFV